MHYKKGKGNERCKYAGPDAPVIEEPVVHAGGVEEVEAGQAPHHVPRQEVPQADHAALAAVLHQATSLTRSEYNRDRRVF